MTPSCSQCPVTVIQTMAFNSTLERGEKRLIAASSRSSTSAMTAMPRHSVPTILFVPEVNADYWGMLDKQAVSGFVEAAVPGEVKDVRINSRRNILAIDLEHRSALEVLR